VATEKQFEANRLNAQKSTGPKTPEGRAAVRLNGVTHGLTAETIVLKGESEADFTNLFDSLEAEHDPASATEEALVVQLAMATWRLRRLYHQEAGFYTCQLQSLVGMQRDLNLDDAGRMGHAAAWSESTLGMFNRQEGRLERTFYRALHELQRLRKEREANLALVSQETPLGRSPTCPVVKPTTYTRLPPTRPLQVRSSTPPQPRKMVSTSCPRPPICNDPAIKSTA
jgi:hypothetical protein